MNVPIVMPQLGLTMTEGTVSEWLKKTGDKVLKGEPVFVVSTDKADMEVESFGDGTLAQIVVEAGRIVPVGTVLAYLDRPDDSGGITSPTTTEQDSTAIPAQPSKGESITPISGNVPTTTSHSAEGRRPVTPRARRLARELGTDLTRVQGSGRAGRIVEEDVRKAAASSHHQSAPSADRPPLRQIIAEKMTRSVQTIPHFSLNLEVEASQLIALREAIKAEVERATGSKLTLTDLLLKATALALRETPELNAAWEDGAVRNQTGVDIGLAIATDRGVVAPVIRNAACIDLAEIASVRRSMTKKAAEGRLLLSELEGGSGTLSNLGMYRVDSFRAIINPGQSFILTSGKVRNRPWVETTVEVRPTVVLDLCVDHRLADGAMAAVFLGRVAEIIESPFRLLWMPGRSDDPKYDKRREL